MEPEAAPELGISPSSRKLPAEGRPGLLQEPQNAAGPGRERLSPGRRRGRGAGAVLGQPREQRGVLSTLSTLSSLSTLSPGAEPRC